MHQSSEPGWSPSTASIPGHDQIRSIASGLCGIFLKPNSRRCSQSPCVGRVGWGRGCLHQCQADEDHKWARRDSGEQWLCAHTLPPNITAVRVCDCLGCKLFRFSFFSTDKQANARSHTFWLATYFLSELELAVFAWPSLSGSVVTLATVRSYCWWLFQRPAQKKKESMIIKIKSGHCRHHNNTNGIWESKQKYISVISETD